MLWPLLLVWKEILFTWWNDLLYHRIILQDITFFVTSKLETSHFLDMTLPIISFCCPIEWLFLAIHEFVLYRETLLAIYVEYAQSLLILLLMVFSLMLDSFRWPWPACGSILRWLFRHRAHWNLQITPRLAEPYLLSLTALSYHSETWCDKLYKLWRDVSCCCT